jgi:ABC-2 type transport system permease protein
MFAYLYTSSIREFTALKKLMIWVFGIIAILILAYTINYFVKGDTSTMKFDRLISMMGFRVTAIVSAVYSTWVIASEVEQRTIVYLLTRPIPRPVLIFSRALASITAVGILSTLVTLVLWMMSGAPGGLPMREIGISWLGAFAYGGLFLFVSLILNRAMIYCLLYAFGWEALVPNMPGEIFLTSIQWHMSNLAKAGKTVPEAAPTLLGGSAQTANIAPMVSVSILVIGFVLMMGLSAYWFKTFEYVPREDAE